MFEELCIVGTIIEFRSGHPCARAIVRSIGRKEVVLGNLIDGVSQRIDRKSLEDTYNSAGLKFLAESHDLGQLTFIELPEAEQLETNRRYKYVKKLREREVTKVTIKRALTIIQEVAQELGEKPPHWQTVRNWYANFSESEHRMRGLFPKHRFKGRREPKIHPKVIEIIRLSTARYYQAAQRSMATVYRGVEDRVMEHNINNPDLPLSAPTFRTVSLRVLDILHEKKQKGRNGTNSFNAEMSTNEGIVTNRILERVEIDHTQLDIHVLDDERKTLIGRPYITALVDHYSHMVVGLQLSFEYPSYAGVCMACLNSFLPKKEYLELVGCETPWPAHGIPSLIVTDNGSEFWGKNFGAVAEELGSVFQYCPVRRPNYKSRVERFFGMVNSFVLDDLPGVVRKAGKHGDGYVAAHEARFTFSEFRKYLISWITGVYHNTPIVESPMTPNELWCESEECFPVPEEDEMDITPILMATDTSKLTREGIKKHSTIYRSDILKDLYRRTGPVSVRIKYNPFDLGYILVLDEINKVYIKAESKDFAQLSGVSDYEYKKIRSRAALHAKSKLANPDLCRARVSLFKEREEVHSRNARRKRQVTTSKSARSDQIGIPNINPKYGSSRILVDSDIGAQDLDLPLTGWSND